MIERLELDNGMLEPSEDIPLPSNEMCRKIWLFLEHPESSGGAKVGENELQLFV